MKAKAPCDPPETSGSDMALPPATIAERLAHKIRSPLSFISAAASRLQEPDETPADHDDLAYAQAVLPAAEQIEDILRRFTQYSCLEPPETQVVNINELCRTEISSVEYPIIFPPKNNLPEIGCDPYQMRLIPANLVEIAGQARGYQCHCYPPAFGSNKE